MQELIKQLTEKAGITTEQAGKSIDVIKGFIKEKYPMLGDAVDKVMDGGATPTANATAAPIEEKKEETGMLDKISDVIPGQVGEKIENFAKGIGDKIGGIFGK